MKKYLGLLVSLLILSPAVSFAAQSSLGSVSKTVAVGETLTVDLGQSPTGRWFAPSLSNDNKKAAIITTFGNNLIIQGLTTGNVKAKVCTEIQNDNCMNISVKVSGSVLGQETSVHQSGTWVKSGATIYYVTEAGLIPVPTWKIFLSNGGKTSMVVKANESDLNLPLLPLMTLKDSRVK